jgi:ABC-2 type transport system permease protein
MRRELSAYFGSPIGYIYLAVFYYLAGYYFAFGPLMADMADISSVFSSLFVLVLFLVPILTMRLLSEDRRHKTDQALLTAPITLPRLVLGKYLAALAVFLIGLCVTLVYALVVAVFAPPGWPVVLGNFLAMTLLGSGLISIGMFISSLTENQVIAAVGGFVAGFALLLVDSSGLNVSDPRLVKLIDGISFSRRYADFSSGIFDFSDIFFFLSVTAIFLFLTVRVFENRRWG